MTAGDPDSPAPPPASPPTIPAGAAGIATPPPEPVPEVAPVPPSTPTTADSSQAAPASVAPAAPPPTPRAAPGPQLPSVAHRAVVAVVVSLVLLIVLVFLPVVLLNRLAGLSGQGIAFSTSITTTTVIVYGVLVSILYGLRSALRPTRAYGPLTAVVSLVGIVYLLYLARVATFTVGGSNTSIGLDVGPFITLLALVPLFGVLSGIVTTVEDFARPGERLRVEYPAAA